MRVLVDWVPNHTSDQHPWFVEARSGPQQPEARLVRLARRFARARLRTTGRARSSTAPTWTWDDATGQWYLHCFLPEQPDLNWANPEVVEAMHGVVRFWLDRGVDGFRIDVVHVHRQATQPARRPARAWSAFPIRRSTTARTTHAILRRICAACSTRIPGERMMVGEVYLLSTARVAKYYGAGDELHLAFNFPPLYAPWDAGAWRERVERVDRGARPHRRMADVGALQPRQPPPPHPLRRIGGAGTGGRRAAAHLAGHTVPLRRARSSDSRTR